MLESKIRVKLAEQKRKQKDFAKELGVKPQTLSGWVKENGNKPSLEQAFKIAKILECKVDDLWIYEEE